jgi:molecular chaperone HtpG
MAKSKPTPGTRHTVKIDLPGLIHLLAKSLYAESDVFIREMIQNGHDSIQRRIEAEGEQAPAGIIRIVADHAAGTLTFTDNGSGMTESEVHTYLATIGRSGTDEFRKQLLASGRHMDVTVIGRFGIGLLSAFVAARRVVVETRSIVPDSLPYRWISEGQSEYELEPGSKAEPGTSVTLYIADDHWDMLDESQLDRAVKKYADFIPVGIYLNDAKATVNAVNAPWHRNYPSDDQRLAEYWTFANRRFPDLPLEVIPVDVHGPPRVQGILYISDQHVPDIASAGLMDIYQARMFITAGNRDLLPSWAKFVRGVIDSPDLSPTAARDAIQQDSASRSVREKLGQVIVDHLRGLARRDPQKFERLVHLHAYHVKGMAVQHDDFFDAICDLVPFETNRGLMTLRSYLDQSPKIVGQRQSTIHYFSERGSATQFYMLCNAKELLAINASYVFDQEFLRKYADRHADVRLHLISVAGSDFLFEPIKADVAQGFRQLERDFEATMPHPHSRAQTVRFAPATLPAVTVLTKEARAQREWQEFKESAVVPEFVRKVVNDVLGDKPHVPVVLQLNAENTTVQELARMAGTPLAKTEEYKVAVLAVYNNAILLAQHLMTPENAQAAFGSSNKIISLLIKQTEQFRQTQAQLTALELRLRELENRNITDDPPLAQPRHIVCFAALPFKDNETFAFNSVLLPALRTVLEQAPYFWQVVRADEAYQADKVEDSVGLWLQRSDAYIADISSLNGNVLMELGFMQWAEPARGRPRIVLEREGAGAALPNLGGFIKVCYPQVTGREAIDDLAKALAAEFTKINAVQRLNRKKGAHYLSPLYLQSELGEPEGRASLISKKYVTMEEFSGADATDIVMRVPTLRKGIAEGLKKEVANRLETLRKQP